MLKNVKVYSVIMALVFVLNLVGLFYEIDARADTVPEIVKVYTAEDSWVSNDETNRNISHGAHTQLSAMSTRAGTYNDSILGYQYRVIFLKFDLRNINKPIKSAKLKFSYYTAARTPLFHAVSDDAWSENNVVYDNKPLLGETLASKDYTSTSSTWVDETTGIDLSNYIIAQKASDGIASVGIDIPKIESTSSSDFRIKTTASAADKSERPYLEIEFKTGNEYSAVKYFKGANEINKLESGTITSKMDAFNYNDTSTSAVLITALYKDGRVEKISVKKNYNILGGGVKTPLECDIEVPEDGGIYILKTLLWDSMTEMIALSDETQFGSNGIITE